jgi:hypothetical protein
MHATHTSVTERAEITAIQKTLYTEHKVGMYRNARDMDDRTGEQS